MRVISIVIGTCVVWLGEARLRTKSPAPFLPPNDALPYAHRGIKLWQVEAFVQSYAIGAGSTVLRKVCDKFNSENSYQQQLPQDDADYVYPCNPDTPQAYDMVDHLIVPLTDPDRYSAKDAPHSVNWTLPAPTLNISLAELLNPEGFPDGVDIFMTWSWEAGIEELAQSLRSHAEAVYLDVNKSRPEDVVFWICAFVLNEHQVDDELSGDLSMAPFRLGLGYAKHAIMLLNADNYGRVLTAWNYFEVLVCYILSTDLRPIGSGVWHGKSGENIQGIWSDDSSEAKAKYLDEFDISLGVPDYRTGATDSDLQMILELIGTTQLGVDGLTNRIKNMIAKALTNYALQKLVDSADLMLQPAVQNSMLRSWGATEDSLSALVAQKQQFTNVLMHPVVTPSCLADVPVGMDVRLLDNTVVPRNFQLTHQTPVTIQCANGNSIFISSCECDPKQWSPFHSTCTWSTPRPLGEQSCWPEHATGDMDCHDHLPLPPVTDGYCSGAFCTARDLIDLLCIEPELIVV